MLFEAVKVGTLLRNISSIVISQLKEPESEMKPGKEGKMLFFLVIFSIF